MQLNIFSAGPDATLHGLSQGFEWINQAREGAHQAKWGYAGSQPGSSLSIQVGMGNATDGNATTPRQTLVGLGVLKSYEGMGKASVSCVPPSHVQPQDCSCGFWQIDMHHEHHTSQVRNRSVSQRYLHPLRSDGGRGSPC